MNAVIKHFQDFKEVPVDKLVYSMYRLQLSYGLQLNKSIRGFGPFTPANECQLAALQLPECAATVVCGAYEGAVPSVAEFAGNVGITSTPVSEPSNVSGSAKRSRFSRKKTNKRLKFDTDIEPLATEDNLTVPVPSPVPALNRYLTEADVQVLSEESCLNDNIINAAQVLLRGQAVDRGLRDTVTVAAHCAQVGEADKFVQIIHDQQAQHWFVLTNRGSTADKMRIYCSLHMKPSDVCMQSVLKFLKSSESKLTFEIMNVARQTGSTDCGLYAIAYAQCLLSGKDPVNAVFDQTLMRKHLLTAFDHEELSEFPVTSLRVVRRKVLRSFSLVVYCVCRGGCLTGEQMIACDTCKLWLHRQCIGMSDDDFKMYSSDKRKVFTCTMCKTKHSV